MYKVLKFLVGHINYGGRVTDEWDIRTLMYILDTFYTPEILDNNYKFSPSGIYYSPPAESFASYRDDARNRAEENIILTKILDTYHISSLSQSTIAQKSLACTRTQI